MRMLKTSAQMSFNNTNVKIYLVLDEIVSNKQHDLILPSYHNIPILGILTKHIQLIIATECLHVREWYRVDGICLLNLKGDMLWSATFSLLVERSRWQLLSYCKLFVYMAVPRWHLISWCRHLVYRITNVKVNELMQSLSTEESQWRLIYWCRQYVYWNTKRWKLMSSCRQLGYRNTKVTVNGLTHQFVYGIAKVAVNVLM